jgi:hypothetical protein
MSGLLHLRYLHIPAGSLSKKAAIDITGLR